MVKRIADLSAKELDRLAAEAWFEASQTALKAGVPVVGRHDGNIVRRHADGRTEILGDANPLESIEPSTAEAKVHSSPILKRARETAR